MSNLDNGWSYLGNGWTDFCDIWCMAREPLDMHFAQVKGWLHLYVRTRAPLFHIWEPPGVHPIWMYHAEIWCVVKEPLTMRFTQVMGR